MAAAGAGASDSTNAANKTDVADGTGETGSIGAVELFGGAAAWEPSESVAASFWQRSVPPPYATRNFRRGIPLAAFSAGSRAVHCLSTTANVSRNGAGPLVRH